MKTRTALLLSLIILLAAGFVYGQSLLVKASIPFAFKVEGKTLAAGQYQFIPDANLATIRVVGPGTATGAIAQVMTRMAAGIHTTPNDAHIVFDKVGDVFTLSEIWVPGQDAFMLHVTKEKHEHRIVDVPK